MSGVLARFNDMAHSPLVGTRDVRAAVIYAVVVLVLFAAGIEDGPLLGALTGGESLWPEWVSLVLMLVSAVFTLFRTSRPELLLVVVLPLTLMEMFWGSQTSAYVLIVEALWAPVARGSRRIARATTTVGVVIGVLLGAVFLLAAAATPAPLFRVVVFAAMIIVVVVVTPLAWAWEVRHHRLAQEAAEELASMEHELAGERAAREVEADRLRIAQDLHDVVAGHLSAVALHTSLAEELEDHAARERSLETARGSAEAALRDLRSVIGVLASSDDDDADDAPGGRPQKARTAQTTLSWDFLQRRLGDGATVTIEDNVASAPASARAAMLHIGAEAVTNAVRHGEEPRTLTVEMSGNELTMTCRNRCKGGVGVSSDRADDSPSMGLRTMANRAAAVGGVVQAGPDENETWTVTARLPAHSEEHSHSRPYSDIHREDGF